METPSFSGSDLRLQQDRIIEKIDRTAESLSGQVNQIYARLDQIQGRWRDTVNALERHPGRVIVATFLTGVAVGIWLSQD
jgi:hypothetical protein